MAQSAQEPLGPELAELVREAERQTAEAEALVAPLDEAGVGWRPAPDKWSVGEHLAHLAATNRRYLEAIAPAAEEARRRGLVGAGPYRHGMLGNWFVRSMEPPARMKVKTFKYLEPAAGLTREGVLADFRATQEALVAALLDARGIDLGRASMRSPFLRVLRLSLGQAFAALLAHNRRHLWHVRRVLAAPGFPAA